MAIYRVPHMHPSVFRIVRTEPQIPPGWTLAVKRIAISETDERAETRRRMLDAAEKRRALTTMTKLVYEGI